MRWGHERKSAVSDCACFEYVGDNPYCPVHGKAAKVSEVPNEAEVLVRKSSGGKFIAMYVPARLVEDE